MIAPLTVDEQNAAEETAAYAEAREQGVLPFTSARIESARDHEVPHAADRDPATTVLTVHPAITGGLDSDSTTTVLPLESVAGSDTTELGVAAAPDPSVGNDIPPFSGTTGQTAPERKGAAREAARQARQRRAADRLAASKTTNWRNEPVRTALRGLGQTLITAGVVLLLFVVYEVYVTDLFGASKQAAVHDSMEQQWAAASASTTPSTTPDSTSTATADTVVNSEPPVAADPAQRTRKYATVIGQGFANILIPAFGADYTYTIVEGTTTQDLYGNPGHYDDTQYPGELGNFAVAGHRVSKGSPFNALGTLSSCDAIVIETQDDWFVYRVLPMTEEMASWNPAARPECADVAPLAGEYANLAGREITVPSDYAQVLPVPGVNAAGPAAAAAATQRLITLTTCHPQFSDRQRMIIHGVLTKSYAKAAGFLPPELSE